MPGIFIGGNQADAPQSWEDTSKTHEIKLEVKGTIPRVVIVWVVQVDGVLHVVGAKDSVWVKRIGQLSNVRMRLGDNTYSLTANLVTSNWEPILEAYTNKYREDYPDIVNSFPTIEDAAATTAVFRLTP